jgi:hypothetical protein
VRRRLWVALIATLLLSTGCGNRHVIVTVDLLSYLDPSVTRVAFGPVPAIPGGIYTGEQEVVKDTQVQLIDGSNSIAEVQNVSISMTAIAADSTGSGLDTLRLYVSEVDQDPLATIPAVTLPIVLTPGVTDTVHVDLGSDSRVADLFTGKRMRLTLTTALRGPDSGDPLNATVRVTALDAVLVAGRKDL